MTIVPCAWYVLVPAPHPAPTADGVRSMTLFSMERTSLVVRSRRRCCAREQLQA
jgi:hypothetical protein